MRRVFLAELLFSLPGFFWPVIDVHAQLESSNQSSMSFLEMDSAKFDKLRVIMDVSFLLRHTSRATNKPPKRMYFQSVVPLYILVYFILIMFSSNLKLSTWCTQIHHNTSPLGAGGSSSSTSAKIWTYGWSSMFKATANIPWTVSSVSTVCWRKVAAGQLNYKCTGPAN